MKHLFKTGFLCLVFIFSASVSAETIQKSKILALIERIDMAVVNKDLTIFEEVLSEDFEITLEIKISTATQVMKANKSQYIKQMKEGLKVISEHSYKHSDPEISIEADKAIVKSTIYERAIIQGKTLISKSREISTLKKVDGKLLITKTTGYTEMSMPQ